MDGHARALMGWAEDRVRLHALKCLGRSYFTAEKVFVERSVGGMEWQRLVKECGLGWQLDGDGKVVTIRRMKIREDPVPASVQAQA